MHIFCKVSILPDQPAVLKTEASPPAMTISPDGGLFILIKLMNNKRADEGFTVGFPISEPPAASAVIIILRNINPFRNSVPGSFV